MTDGVLATTAVLDRVRPDEPPSLLWRPEIGEGRAGLVKPAPSRYPAGPMTIDSTTIDKDTLRALAQARGLALSEADLDGLLPLVRAGRALVDGLATAPLDDVEPTVHYQMD